MGKSGFFSLTSENTVAESLSPAIFATLDSAVNSTAMSPDGRQVIAGLKDGTLQLFDLMDGSPVGQPFTGHISSVRSVSFSQDGQFIVSGSFDNTIRLWSLDGSPVGQPFTGHISSVSSVSFSPDGKSIVSGSEDNTIRLWSLDGSPVGKPFTGHTDSVLSVSFSPDGKFIVSSAGYTIRLWTLEGSPMGQPFKGHTLLVSSVSFSPDGKSIVSSSFDGTIRLWSLDGSLVGQPFTGHTAPVLSVSFSPDGKSIVSGSNDNTIRLWTLEGGPVGQAFTGHTAPVLSVSFSPDGKSIVSGSDDDTIRLWSLDGSPVGQPFRGHAYSVSSVSFSPDGKSIVSGSFDGTIRLWTLDGSPVGQKFTGHFEPVRSVSFSPDGKSIVSGGDDNTIQLWTLDGSPVGKPFTGHRSYVLSVSFSPDGKSIVSGSLDRTIRLWTLEGRPVGKPFTGHTDSVLSVSFSPDGKSIVSGSNDTSICLSQLNPDHQITQRWQTPPIMATAIKSLSERIDNIFISQGIQSDRAFGRDALEVEDEINALTEVLLLRSLTPPVAVGMLGNWGSGKSFGMHLIRAQIKTLRRQEITALQAWGRWSALQDEQRERMSPFVGHIYQIQFNAWTYAKSNLWASLMQEIFYELNRQITLEQKLANFLSGENTPMTASETQSNPIDQRPHHTPYKFLNQYILRHYRTVQSFDRWLTTHISTQTLSIISFLDLVFWQMTLHLGVLLYLLLVLNIAIFRELILLPIKWTNKKRFEDIELCVGLSDALGPFLSTDWLTQQYTKYYFPDLHLPNKGKWAIFLKVIEHSLFLCFDGFPRRLHDRKKYWHDKKKELQPESAEKQIQKQPQHQETDPPSSGASFRHNQALRQGGDLWQVLYELNEADANSLLKQQLSPKELAQWNSLNSAPDISNVLWSTLDAIQIKETQNFQALEHQLQEAEKTLERKRKSNEVDIHQTLKQRKLNALWIPVFNGIARLKFSKEEIETFSASGKSYQKFRDTMMSWQGLIVLFCMGFLIVITLSPEGREPILQLLQAIGNYQPIRQLTQTLPDWLQTIPSQLINLINWLKTNIHPWFQIGSATLIGLIPVLKALTTYIDSVQKEQARIQGERDVLLKQSQAKVKSESEEVNQLRLKVEEERCRLGPNAQYSSLLDFVNARLSGDDYGKHLGLMQQVKQDLAALSTRLTLNKGNEKEIQALFPRGPARVFLYIDDLDRCPPDRVVEVLEAVQLLLNTELFVVILAIDDRYIARALEQVYAGVLKRRGKPSGIDYLEKIIQIPYRMRPISTDTVENYFRSQLMIKDREEKTKDDSGYSVGSQTSTKNQSHSRPELSDIETKSDEVNEQENDLFPTDHSPQAMLSPLAEALNQPVDSLPDSLLSVPIESASQTLEGLKEASKIPSTPISSIFDGQQDLTQYPKNSEIDSDSIEPNVLRHQAEEPSKQENITYNETIATVEELDESELKLLVECCQYVDITPRTGKRLINIYKILQIIWSTRNKEKAHPLPTDTDKRVVMSFLALSGRYPDFMRSLFDEIDMRLEIETFNTENGEPRKNPSIPIHLSDLIEAIQPQFNPSNRQDFHTKREWTRFDKDIKHMLPALKSVPEVSEYRLDRRTFSLMLSFCFVGDLGYDPDDFQDTPFPASSNPSH